MASNTQSTMVGKRCPNGPGGRDCPCCGHKPGRDRTAARRRAKRAERQSWKKTVARGED